MSDDKITDIGMTLLSHVSWSFSMNVNVQKLNTEAFLSLARGWMTSINYLLYPNNEFPLSRSEIWRLPVMRIFKERVLWMNFFKLSTDGSRLYDVSVGCFLREFLQFFRVCNCPTKCPSNKGTTIKLVFQYPSPPSFSIAKEMANACDEMQNMRHMGYEIRWPISGASVQESDM